MLFPLEYIKLFDIVMILIVLLAIYSGYRQGFLLKVLDCFGLIVSAFIAWFLSKTLSFIPVYPSAFLMVKDGTFFTAIYEVLNEVAWFFIVFVILNITVRLLHPLCSFVRHIPIVSTVNRVLGMLFGAVQAVILFIVVAVLFRTPLFANGEAVIHASYLEPFHQIGNKVLFLQRNEIEELNVLQKVMTPSTKLTEEEKEIVVEWMRANHVSEAEIQAFLAF